MNINKLKELIKLQITYPEWRELKKNIKKHKEPTFYIFGGPVHGNLGDHAIMEEEKNFLKEFFPSFECVEILMPFYHTQKNFLEKYIKNTDIICISGGGWMGNLWIHNEKTIREIVTAFMNNQIIIFPQTLFYTLNVDGINEMEKTVSIIEKHLNLIFCVRDMNSYTLVKDKFQLNGKSILYYCPDMVLFQRCKMPKVEREKKVQICIREDCEALNESVYDKIVSFIPQTYKVQKISTVKSHLIKYKKRKDELEKIWKEFASTKLIITDRLHAMLFAYINDTPCIVLNNKTGKVFGVYRWIEAASNIYCANCVEEIENMIPKLLSDNPKGFRKKEFVEFENLAVIIKEKGDMYENKKIACN